MRRFLAVVMAGGVVCACSSVSSDTSGTSATVGDTSAGAVADTSAGAVADGTADRGGDARPGSSGDVLDADDARPATDVEADSGPLESDVAGLDASRPDTVTDPPLPPAAVSGTLRIFGPPGGPLEGATVTILEHPGLSAVSDADGRYTIPEVPSGDVTLVMHADGYPENQLGTQRLEGVDLGECDFQAVSDGIYSLFAMLTESTPDPAYCQISTTITRYFEGKLPTVHGEPGATASMEPPAPAPPIYFNADVLPTPALVETTVDGGVVWTNVPPGDYVLSAHKGQLPFEPVRIRCRAGVLINAGPPRGLQALAPGDGY